MDGLDGRLGGVRYGANKYSQLFITNKFIFI